MAGGFPLAVNAIPIRTSEALYQACRFPHMPDVQRQVIEEKSPMSAKMVTKPYRSNSRPDWDEVRVDIMRWVLQVKLAQNWSKFCELLLRTGDRSIVEHSRRDPFWGARPIDAETLVGSNVLGRLLKQLRERVIHAVVKELDVDSLLKVEPLEISDFLLYGQPIEQINTHNMPVPLYAMSVREPSSQNPYSAETSSLPPTYQGIYGVSYLPGLEGDFESSPNNRVCNKCGASKGERCITSSGKPAKKTHSQR